MNVQKLTQKSLHAVNDLEKIAYEYGNQEVEQEHLLYSLLNQEDSLILKLIENSNPAWYRLWKNVRKFPEARFTSVRI